MALPYATEDQLKQLKTQLANVGNKSVKTKEELDALKGTDGQLVYCQGDSKLYIFKKDKWEEVGGGKSVPPTLNLIDFETNEIRTTITEEEYNNLKNGLYNQVIYGNNFSNNITPNRLFCFITDEDAEIYFSYLSFNENGNGLVGVNAYSIDLGEKNNNQYPITINNLGVTPFETNIPNINAIATAINNLYQLSKSPTSSFVMNINESNDVHKVLMNYVYDGNRYYCYGIESIINNIVTYYASNNNEQAINIYKHTLDLNNTNSKTISLFGKHSILVPKDSADASILPLPADASTSTYVLKAVNGTVQWVKE